MGILNRKILSNTVWIVGCRIVQSLLALVINMISARYLGPSNYGLLNYVSSIVAFVVPLAQLGLRNVLVEEIVSHPEREGETLGTTLVMSAVASLFCLAGCMAFVLAVNADERDTLIVLALYGISLVFQMTEMIQYWYQAKLLSKYTAITSLFAYVIVTIYKIVLLVCGKNIYWFAVSNALDYCLISIILLILYNKLGRQRLSFSLYLGKKMFSRSKYYIVAGMMVTIFSQTDKIMIKNMLGNAENGYYSIAISCAGFSGFVFMAIIDSFRPVILASRKESMQTFERNLSLLYCIIIYLGFAQSVFITIFAKLIVNIFYGSAYLPAAIVLQIIVWYTAFSYMGVIRNIWILAESKQKCLWKINLFGALLNVIGNLILIPIMGVAGAAISSVATQFFANFVLSFIMKPIRKNGILMLESLNPKFLIEITKKMLKEKNKPFPKKNV